MSARNTVRRFPVGPGDEVFASTLTFIGSVTPVVFEGATPVFIDCDRESWNMDDSRCEWDDFPVHSLPILAQSRFR